MHKIYGKKKGKTPADSAAEKRHSGDANYFTVNRYKGYLPADAHSIADILKASPGLESSKC